MSRSYVTLNRQSLTSIMNYRALTIVLGILIVSCVFMPTQRSPFSDAIKQFKTSKTTGTEVADAIRPYSATSYSASLDTFAEHRYGVYQWTGRGIIIVPLKPFFAPLTCMSPSPIEKDRNPRDEFMLIEFDDKDLLVRYEVVSKEVPSGYSTTLDLRTEFKRRLLSDTWSIEAADLTIDVDPYQIYLQDKNQPDAKSWLCKAADEPNPEALDRLGVLYENGSEGLPKNLEIAYFWYKLGAEVQAPWWLNYELQKNHWSEAAAMRIENELTPEQRANVANEIRAWKPGECKQLLIRDDSLH